MMRSSLSVRNLQYFFMTAVLAGCRLDARATEVAEGQPSGESRPANSRPDVRQLSYFTFFDLLQKAERIVVAEVGKDKDGTVILTVKQSLKGPAPAAKKIDPEAYKLAAARLSDPNAAPPPAPAATVAPPAEVLRVQTEKAIPLPPDGTQAVFFLWEHVSSADAAFQIAHPQCIYDIELLPQIRAGATRPRAVADGRYIREWDRQMAQRARQRDADRALDQLKGGETVMGLRIVALRPQLSVRHDNSFALTAKLENSHNRDQAIYDGPAGGFAVRLRPKDGGPSFVLHVSAQSLVAGIDSSVLSIADALDFSSVPHDSSLTKELFFDSKTYPALANLNGEYVVSAIYSSAFDGAGLDIGSTVWTGTIISEEAKLIFSSDAPTRPQPAQDK